MGVSVKAEVNYGVAFVNSETGYGRDNSLMYPPAWATADDWGGGVWNLPDGLLEQLLEQDGYNYDNDDEEFDLETLNSDALYELLYRFLKLRGWDNALTVDTHGNRQYGYSAPMVVAKGYGTSTYCGEVETLALQDPKNRAAVALDEFCTELEIPAEHCGWNLTCYMG